MSKLFKLMKLYCPVCGYSVQRLLPRGLRCRNERCGWRKS